MIEFIYEETEMLEVAKVVVKYNKYRLGTKPDDMVKHMKQMAQISFQGPGYVCVLGYVLIAYKYPGVENGLGIKASVEAHILADLIR